MKKELPKMYQNKIKKIPNIQKVYSTYQDNTTNIERNINNKKYSNISIEKKIDNIFNSSSYVYKADVFIETDDEILQKRIIARNRTNIITIDNEYIPISIIRDIYK